MSARQVSESLRSTYGTETQTSGCCPEPERAGRLWDLDKRLKWLALEAWRGMGFLLLS